MILELATVYALTSLSRSEPSICCTPRNTFVAEFGKVMMTASDSTPFAHLSSIERDSKIWKIDRTDVYSILLQLGIWNTVSRSHHLRWQKTSEANLCQPLFNWPHPSWLSAYFEADHRNAGYEPDVCYSGLRFDKPFPTK